MVPVHRWKARKREFGSSKSRRKLTSAGLTPSALLKGKTNVAAYAYMMAIVKDSSLTLLEGSLQFVSARGQEKIEVRVGAAAAALTVMEEAHLTALKLHRSVNHGYASLSTALEMKLAPGYKRPY